MKIILVDDEKKFITMLAKRLILRNIQADAVFSGTQAIEKVRTTAYDLAVLDIKMPGISGVELKNKLSSINPDLKFIFVTGHGAPGQADSNLTEKDCYLSKPLNIENLIKKIKQITGTDH